MSEQPALVPDRQRLDEHAAASARAYAATCLIVASGRDSYNTTASALNSAE
ncbi:hypothetical protein ACFVZR_37630 [Streptomyces sp. NPDC058316]|uniref:hypothetical protein n=1 Tax=unclassified Streptomyces TaxID=2593676 RepID=UPI003322EE87